MTAFVATVSLALMVATGLVLDGGEILAARRQATDAAEAAARAGAQAVDVDLLRRHVTALDGGGAVAAARSHLAAAGLRGRVEVEGARVVVTVSVRRRLQVLGLVGMRTVTVTGTGDARLVRGVSRGET